MLVCDVKGCSKPAAHYYNLADTPGVDLCPMCKAEHDRLFADWLRGRTLVVVEVCTAHGHINVSPCPACTTDTTAKQVAL